MIGGQLLTLGETANELRCSVSTVKRRIKDGSLPAFVDGHLKRVREDDLRRYIAERVSRRATMRAPVAPAGRKLPERARLWD